MSTTKGIKHNSQKKPAATVVNIQRLIEKNPELTAAIGLNEFAGRVVQRYDVKGVSVAVGEVRDRVNGDGWTDRKTLGVRVWLEQEFVLETKSSQIVHDAIEAMAMERSFHPVREYLEACEGKWDGVARIEEFFVSWLGMKDSAYARETSRIWFLGAVRRIMKPGCQMDLMPVLIGIQGVRKSALVAALAKNESWFCEIIGKGLDNKQVSEVLTGKWICEMSELSATRGTENIENVKAVVSARKFTGRLAYGRTAQDVERSSVFMGTTNDETPFTDTTGSRRFPPIRCSVGLVDVDGVRRIVDELWGEAMTIFGAWDVGAAPDAGNIYYTSKTRTESENVQLNATSGVDDTGPGGVTYENLRTLLNGRCTLEVVTMAEIWQMMGRNPLELHSGHSNKIARALRSLGLERVQEGTGERRKVWVFQRDIT